VSVRPVRRSIPLALPPDVPDPLPAAPVLALPLPDDPEDDPEPAMRALARMKLLPDAVDPPDVLEPDADREPAPADDCRHPISEIVCEDPVTVRSPFPP